MLLGPWHPGGLRCLGCHADARIGALVLALGWEAALERLRRRRGPVL